MAETPPSGGGLRSAFNTLLILALIGVVGWLAAERNNHHYFIHTEGRTVLIERGWELPYGHGPYHPRDPAQNQAYAAIHLPDGTKGPVEEEFEERGDLDRRLGDILLEAAKARLGQSDAARLPEGIAYLDQAALLQQLTSDQRHQLHSQRAEVAYFEASDRIARALAALQDARGLLKLAATGSHSNARDAADLLDRMGPPLEGLLRATRGSAILPADDAELPPPATPTPTASPIPTPTPVVPTPIPSPMPPPVPTPTATPSPDASARSDSRVPKQDKPKPRPHVDQKGMIDPFAR
jgi:hypothetical protein